MEGSPRAAGFNLLVLYDYDMTKPNTRGKGAVSKGCDCAKKIIA